MAQKEFHPFWSERYWNIHNWRDTGTLQEADTRWNHFLKGLWRYADAIDSIVAFRHCVYGFLPVTLTPPRMCTRRPCWDFTCFFAAYTAYRDRKCVSRKWFFMFCQFQGCFFCNLRLAIEIYPATRTQVRRRPWIRKPFYISRLVYTDSGFHNSSRKFHGISWSTKNGICLAFRWLWDIMRDHVRSVGTVGRLGMLSRHCR